MSKELTPLKPDQLQVSRLPRFTTELPFFYLTKKKELLDRAIKFQAVDEQGRPISWTVTPNIHPNIGAPSIDAHEVWVKALRPAIRARQSNDGSTPTIIPIGKCREALRAVGWGIGGWEARRLLKALRQICFAGCEADFWLPTNQTDEQGKVLFKPIKGMFTRMSLYQIGSKHLTEEELKSGNFDFDFELDDTIYVQLHPLEIEMQRSQQEQLVDNEYLFSVSPSARRWYELLAPKFYGVIKNNGEYCEIRYSWYVQHHPTLKREQVRWKVSQQMNKVIKDHLAFGYVSKVVYRTVKEPDQEVDYIIRYYPGEAAKESTVRILGYIRGQKKATQLPSSIESEEKVEKLPKERILDPRVSALTDRGVAEQIAKRLVASLKDNQPFDDQLEYVDHLINRSPGSIRNPAGYYFAFIRDNAEVPVSFETTTKKKLREEARASQEREVNERATLELAYKEYLDEELERYIAENFSESQYQDLIAAKKLEILKTNKLASSWSEDAFTRLAEPIVRSELRLRLTDLWTLEAFSECQGRGVAVEAAPIAEIDELPDLFPAPDLSAFTRLVDLVPTEEPPTPIVRALADFCPRCEGKRHVLQEGSTTLYELCSCVIGS